MPKLVIQDLKPYDGEYELELSGLTNRDYHRIKQISGVRAGELPEAMSAGDIGVFVAVAEFILKRNGFADVNVDALWDAPEECFQVGEDEAAEDADRPPATATTGGNKNDPGGVASENENTQPSGDSGNTAGESSQPTPLRTGPLGSVTSADFARSTSAD